MNSFCKKATLIALVIILSAGTGHSQYDPSDFFKERIDISVKPGDDFAKYAGGKWLTDNPIPSSESYWGTYNLVMNETYDRMRSINETTAEDMNAVKGSITQKIGDFYHAGMDTVTINKERLNGISEELEMINSITNENGLLKVLAHLQMIGGSPLIGPGVYQDSKNSERYAMYLWQTGIGLPDREYYFKEDEMTSNIRTEYRKHIIRMLQLMGDDPVEAEKNADAILRIEKDLAGASRKMEDLRDPYANYNKMSLAGLNELNPSMRWKEFFTMMKINNIDSVIVGQPEFYKEVEKLLKTVSINDWKAYLRWNLISSFASYLSSDFSRERFNFYGTILSGSPEQRPRWKRILDIQGTYLGDALGQLYVERYYSPETRKRYEDLTDKIIGSYRERITNLNWMSDETKSKALEKLSAVRKKVGYPDKWKDYSSLNISRDSYVENIKNGNLWYYDYYIIKRMGQPVNKEEWSMTPQTYNAYYSSTNNEIVMPAAVFIIPGWNDSLVDDAVIFGYAGAATIGHEITHGFDDEGRQYDGNGNLSNWWTEADEKEFKERADMYVKQFNNFVVLDSLHVNGEATLGENIADLGGLVIALDAFKKTDQFRNNVIINGLTPLQRFFLGYTIGWTGAFRDELLAQQVMSDVHSPDFLRVNGPLANIDEFYEAFGIQPGDKMYIPVNERVRIW